MTSIYTGVSRVKKSGKYRSVIRHDFKTITIGTFFNEIDAAEKYDLYIVHNNIKRKLNFPEKLDIYEKTKYIKPVKFEKQIVYHGVYSKRPGYYSVVVRVNKKQIYIAHTRDVIIAAKTYDKYIIDNNLDKPLNFPDEYPSFDKSIKTVSFDNIDPDLVNITIMNSTIVIIDKSDYNLVKYLQLTLDNTGHVIIYSSKKRLSHHLLNVSNVSIYHKDGNLKNLAKTNLSDKMYTEEVLQKKKIISKKKSRLKRYKKHVDYKNDVKSKNICPCGEDNIALFEFAHHTRLKKTISFKENYSETRLNNELPLGRFLCIWCHRLETKREQLTYGIKKSMNDYMNDAINASNNLDTNSVNIKKCNGQLCKGAYRPFDHFYKKRNIPYKCCISCTNYNGSLRKLEGLKYINDTKIKRGECNHCKIKINDNTLCCFDYDHIKPHIKLYNVSNMTGFKRCKIDTEIAKCQLLCCKCHRLKSINECSKQYIN